MFNYSFGLYKSPRDKRDYILTPFLGVKALSASFDRTGEMTRVRSQGKEGICTWFAMATGCKEWQEKRDYNKFIELSPRLGYEESKKLSGHKEGTTLKATVEVAKEIGTCEEVEWPFYPNDVGKPSSIAYKEALKYRIKTYARITNINELKRAIVEVGPALIGVKVYKGMISDECKKTGVVVDPSCFQSSLGGHALCAVGYSDVSPYFKDGHIKVKNSWGNWGDEGYLYLSYKYIKANMLDAFSLVDIDDDLPYSKTTVGDLSFWQRKNSWV